MCGLHLQSHLRTLAYTVKPESCVLSSKPLSNPPLEVAQPNAGPGTEFGEEHAECRLGTAHPRRLQERDLGFTRLHAYMPTKCNDSRQCSPPFHMSFNIPRQDGSILAVWRVIQLASSSTVACRLFDSIDR